MATYYYAARHTYSILFCNDYSKLFRFPTKAMRDEFVEEANYYEAAQGGYKTEAVTRKEARRHFPNAFRLVGNFHDHVDMRDWYTVATQGRFMGSWCPCAEF